MPKLVRPCSLVLLLLGLAGCVAWPGISPGRLVDLEPDAGILVLHTQAPWPVRSLRLNDLLLARNLAAGTRLRLLILPAGSYRWSEIQLIGDMGRSKYIYTMRMLDDESWDLVVEPGRINYPGQLVVEPGANLGVRDRFAVRSLNRSAMMFELLQQMHPELSKRYPIVYTGHARDEFLVRYQDAVRAGAAADLPTAGGTP